MKIVAGVFLGLMIASFAGATELPMEIAVLRGLDKVTGRISTFSIPVGQTGQFGKTFVVPEACYTHPPEESPENSAFLYVFEKSAKGENIELFNGWMFSSNPALSSMEHPVYDIWVIGCEKSAKTQTSDLVPIEETSAPSPVEPETEEESSQSAEIEVEDGDATQTPAVQLVPSQVQMEDIE